VTRKVHVALSLGWSFSGIHVDVAFGSSPMKAPSSVWMKPYGEPNTIASSSSVAGS